MSWGDVDFGQVGEAGFGVAAASLGVADLPIVQLPRGVRQPLLACRLGQGERIDQGVRRHVNLRERDLRIFFPAAVLSGGPRTND